MVPTQSSGDHALYMAPFQHHLQQGMQIFLAKMSEEYLSGQQMQHPPLVYHSCQCFSSQALVAVQLGQQIT